MTSTRTFLLGALCACGLLLGTGRWAQAQQMSSSDTSSAKDTKLEKKIDSRLQHDQKLKARNLDASVSEGVVTLTGTVRNQSEKDHAEHLAHTKGVSNVDNQIQIEGQEAQPGSTAAPGEEGAQPAAPSGEEQQAQPSEGNVRERSTHVEERSETRTEKMPQQQEQQAQPQQQEPSKAPADENVPPPAEPKSPSAPQ